MTKQLSVLSFMFAAKEDLLQLQYMNMQKQKGGADCGLFAIAVATALCIGMDPTKLTFEQGKMREHLRLCFETGLLTPFPAKANRGIGHRVRSMESIRLHCVCRSPFVGKDKMVQCTSCKKLFHPRCVNVPDVVIAYLCPACPYTSWSSS